MFRAYKAVLGTLSMRVSVLGLLGGLAFAAGAEVGAPIANAAMERDMATVRALLAEGADPNEPGADGTPALHWVVRVDDLETAKALIEAGADATLANPYGMTPLFLATLNGNAAMIGTLLDAGADVNSVDPTGETVLMTAVRSGSFDAAELLLDRGAMVDARDPEFEQTALMFAARENHPGIVRLLLERGAEVNARTRTGETPEFELPNSRPGFSFGVGIVRGGWTEHGMRGPIPGTLSPLLYAAREGHLEVSRILLEAGADVNQADANGIAPLLLSVLNNQFGVARFLVDEGADVNAIDWYGRTPLWATVEVRNLDLHNGVFQNGIDREPPLDLMRVLLERGADPNARIVETAPIRTWMMGIGSLSWVDFTGETPFLKASLSGDLTAMRLLLEYGADPHIATFGGTTALMAAAGINWVVDQTYDEGPEALLEAVKLCLELGMDVNAVNSMGLTAIHGAANRGSDDIIRFLVDEGARLDIADNQGRTPLTWAEGVFLATHASVPKPSSVELITRLISELE